MKRAATPSSTSTSSSSSERRPQPRRISNVDENTTNSPINLNSVVGERGSEEKGQSSPKTSPSRKKQRQQTTNQGQTEVKTRVVITNPEKLELTEDEVDKATASPRTEHLISDSDGAGQEDEDDDDDEEDADDFHSAASQDEFYLKPKSLDILFGRGQPLRDHPGNVRMREIIKGFTSRYRTASKTQKSKIMQEITAAIANNNQHKFLVPVDVQDPDKGCRKARLDEIKAKISHGIRDAIKVEDLLDSEFVQLWANPNPINAPRQPPPPPSFHINGGIPYSSNESVSANNIFSGNASINNTSNPLEPTPLHPSVNANVTPPLHPSSAPSSSNIPPSLYVNYGHMNDPEYLGQSFTNQTNFSNLNNNRVSFSSAANNSVSFHNPQPLIMPGSRASRSNSLMNGPAIFHVSVPNSSSSRHFRTLGDNDEESQREVATEKDDLSSLDSMERAQRQAKPPPPPPTATVTARLVPSASRVWKKRLQPILLALLSIIIVAMGVILLRQNSTSSTSIPEDQASSDVSENITTAPSSTSMLERITARGFLKCGVIFQAGYSVMNPTTGRVEGLDADMCRAIAAGIFGRERLTPIANSSNEENVQEPYDEPIEFVFVETRNRFQYLNSEEVDVLLAITTHTMERQIHERTTQRGYAFSVPYLHNGMVFGGSAEALSCIEPQEDVTVNTESSSICQGLRVCVLDGTTLQDALDTSFPSLTTIAAPTRFSFYQTYRDSDCDLLAAEGIEMIAFQLEQPEGSFRISSQTYSKEPITIVTRDDDVQFSDFVNWILQGLLAAEEVRNNLVSTSSVADLPTPTFFGQDFSFMFHDAVTAVGDFGTIYEKHLAPYIPRGSANQINVGKTGAMYAVPFGDLQPASLPELTSVTIEAIRNRGHLRCGITQASIFAEFDVASNSWKGLDVSFCQAISAAIFDGVIHVRYTVLSPTDRFRSLENGNVDVLARVSTITMERDVLEPSTNTGFTFSPPNFHDEIRFAGIPPYHDCATRLDTTSEACQDLLVCVTGGTTQSQRLQALLPKDNLFETSDTEETIELFVQGNCNAIGGGYVEIASILVVEPTFEGQYQLGSKGFSRESLALVTKEDDTTWSLFVRWVVTALIYAEEQGITKQTYQKMPRVDLFKPLVDDGMFRNAIQAVGSLAEIWDEVTASSGLPREGRNLVNAPPLGPQLISDLLWDKAIS